MGIPSLDKIRIERDPKKKNHCGAGRIVRDGSEGVLAFKLLEQVKLSVSVLIH